MRRVLNRLAALPRRIKASVNSFYALDERLHERMQASRAVTIACVGVAWLGLVTLCVVWWMGRDQVRSRLEALGALLFVSAGLVLLARRRLREQLSTERSKAGLCPACGYDLRSTPGRCPECGTPPAAKGA